MAAGSGRKLRISKGATPIAGARAHTLTINNEPVDITDKDDLGWRTMLNDVGVRSVDAEVTGVLLDSTILTVAMGTASGLLAAYTVAVDGI